MPAAVGSFDQDDQQRTPGVGGAVQERGVLAARRLVPRPTADGLLDLLRRDGMPGDMCLGLLRPPDLPQHLSVPPCQTTGYEHGGGVTERPVEWPERESQVHESHAHAATWTVWNRAWSIGALWWHDDHAGGVDLPLSR